MIECMFWIPTQLHIITTKRFIMIVLMAGIVILTPNKNIVHGVFLRGKL